MTTTQLDPPGKTRAITGVGIRFEAPTGMVAVTLPATHVVRVVDPDVLDNLADRLRAAAALLRRHNDLGELPLIGGQWDPHNRDWWWAD
jgi:hypothetical protein